jgi:hypothetical protein
MGIARLYRYPQFVTLSLPTQGPWRLDAGVRALRHAVTRWRRRAPVWKVIRAGVGGIEPHLDTKQVLWAVHAHIVVDTFEPTPDFADPNDVWDEITLGRGYLLKPEQGFPVVSLPKAVHYVRKPDDWFPAPGVLPLRALKELLDATHRRQPWLHWANKPRASR